MSGATTLSIDNGVGTVTGSSVSVTPAATTTYTLTASNGGVSMKATAMETVAASGGQAIYVMDMNNNRVEEFNSSGVYQNEFFSSGSNGGGFNSPKALAVDGSGNVWVADVGNQSVVKFNNRGTYVLQLGGSRAMQPGSLAIPGG